MPPDPPARRPSPNDIERAASHLRGGIVRTPAIAARALSARLGLDLVLKCETLQQTGSFKERGALTRLLALTPRQRARGVIAMSAGNHGQGVAFHARRLGIAATIVMPRDTPFTKVERTASFGARVVQEGTTLAEAHAAADRIAAEEGRVFVHPYDDPLVIAGQGTVGLELLDDHPDLDMLVVPIGGGGLIAGIAIAAKAIKPSIEIIGVESELYPSMHHRLRGLDMPPPMPTLAEGIAVKEAGRLASEIVRDLVADIVLVSEREIERAVELLMTDQKLVAEGAGAASVAALLGAPDRFADRRVGAVLSGGNIDARLMASVLMRGMVRAGRLVRLRIDITDSPGNLARVAQIIGDLGGNIIEIYHQRLFQELPVKLADVDIVVETRGGEHVRAIVMQLDAAGFRSKLLSDIVVA